MYLEVCIVLRPIRESSLSIKGCKVQVFARRLQTFSKQESLSCHIDVMIDCLQSFIIRDLGYTVSSENSPGIVTQDKPGVMRTYFNPNPHRIICLEFYVRLKHLHARLLLYKINIQNMKINQVQADKSDTFIITNHILSHVFIEKIFYQSD